MNLNLLKLFYVPSSNQVFSSNSFIALYFIVSLRSCVERKTCGVIIGYFKKYFLNENNQIMLLYKQEVIRFFIIFILTLNIILSRSWGKFSNNKSEICKSVIRIVTTINVTQLVTYAT